jgi:hypothetical protein
MTALAGSVTIPLSADVVSTWAFALATQYDAQRNKTARPDKRPACMKILLVESMNHDLQNSLASAAYTKGY